MPMELMGNRGILGGGGAQVPGSLAAAWDGDGRCQRAKVSKLGKIARDGSDGEGWAFGFQAGILVIMGSGHAWNQRTPLIFSTTHRARNTSA